jgi:hypothetical protein
VLRAYFRFANNPARYPLVPSGRDHPELT